MKKRFILIFLLLNTVLYAHHAGKECIVFDDDGDIELVQTVSNLFEKETKDLKPWMGEIHEGINYALCHKISSSDDVIVLMPYHDRSEEEYDLHLVVVLLDYKTWEIKEKFFLESIETSDALYISDITLDIKTYKHLSNYPTFSLSISLNGSSQVNPFGETSLHIYEIKNEKLKVILSELSRSYHGENNGHDIGEIAYRESKYIKEKSTKSYPVLRFKNSYKYEFHDRKKRGNWKVEYGEASFKYINGQYEAIQKKELKLFDLKKIEVQVKKGLKYKSIVLKALLKEEYMSKKNVRIYNDIAYYLDKAGHHREALVILEQLVERFPKRTVAHLNIAETYESLNQNIRALIHYKYYEKQMTSKGKGVSLKVLNKLKPIESLSTFNAKGDLNLDGIEDAIRVAEETDGTRILLLYLGTKDKKYKFESGNEHVIFEENEGGGRGDPFQGIVIKNGYFSVEHYGGMAHRWKDIVTFKYDKKKETWILHKVSRGNYVDKDDADKIKWRIETKNDFGIRSFESYR